MRSHNELILAVIENYLYHKNFTTDSPAVKESLKLMIDIAEMWMMTQ